MKNNKCFYDWVVKEGRKSNNLADLLDKFCQFLNLKKFKIKRVTLALNTLNPQLEALRYVWFDEVLDPGPFPAKTFLFYQKIHHTNVSTIDEAFLSFGCRDNPMFKSSPFYYVEQNGELHLPIKASGLEQHYSIFNDLAELGCTDYFSTKFNYNDDERAVISLVSFSKKGFSKKQIDSLKSWLPFVSILADSHRKQLITDTILDVYLGKNPGHQVLTGSIKPGDVTHIETAIWYSDLRDFTSLSQSNSPEKLIACLNSYFEILVKNIYAEGGEILKFIGDAVLAIFPKKMYGSTQLSVDAAYRCTVQANHDLKELNAQRQTQNLPDIKHGIALHTGELLYGNIGALKRLDFTVIGTTVNLVSRLEGLCSVLGENVICSKDFSDNSSASFKLVGKHSLKGFTEPVPIFIPEGN